MQLGISSFGWDKYSLILMWAAAFLAGRGAPGVGAQLLRDAKHEKENEIYLTPLSGL
jgi:hypothetical protein